MPVNTCQIPRPALPAHHQDKVGHSSTLALCTQRAPALRSPPKPALTVHSHSNAACREAWAAAVDEGVAPFARAFPRPGFLLPGRSLFAALFAVLRSTPPPFPGVSHPTTILLPHRHGSPLRPRSSPGRASLHVQTQTKTSTRAGKLVLAGLRLGIGSIRSRIYR